MADVRPDEERLVVLAVYSWREFWSMGEGCGAPSFHLSIASFPKHGHEMHVLMPGRPGSPRVQDYHGATLHRVRSVVNFMPGTRWGRPLQHLGGLFAYAYWFARMLPAGLALASRVKPDVVIGMGQLGPQVAYRIGRRRDIPNVTRLFGISMFFDVVLASRARLLLRYRETAAIKTPASYVILCDDGSQGDALARHLGVDTSRLLHWPNGVDKTLYSSRAPRRDVRAELGIPKGNAVVLSVSRLYFEKHVDRVVRTVPDLVAARGGVTLVIVGSGEERARLEQLAEELGVAENVVFAGSVDREGLPDYYKAADVFVALSDRTNVSNSLHEAMISSLPVVVLNTGRTADVVENGRTGILIEQDDLASVPAAVLRLLDDPELRSRLGRAAFASADRRLPTIEERQAMEVEVAARAVREHRAAAAVGGRAREAR